MSLVVPSIRLLWLQLSATYLNTCKGRPYNKTRDISEVGLIMKNLLFQFNFHLRVSYAHKSSTLLLSSVMPFQR